MAEDLIVDTALGKEKQYELLFEQLKALTSGEKDLYANLANIAAGLKGTFCFFWVGFYLVKEGELVLGPFQGPIACTRIGFGKGVCGSAWAKEETLIVPNVEEFPGHIACSSLSQSEIVVPVFSEGKVMMVLDVDSKSLDDFDQVDQVGLEKIASLVKVVD